MINIDTSKAVKLEVVHKVAIFQDDYIENPREDWANIATMYCEHSRYNLGDKNAEDIRIKDKKGNIAFPSDYIVLPLYLFDHSGISINTSGFSCSWDSGQVGYIYIRKADAVKVWGKKLCTKKVIEKAIACMKAEVKDYDDYLTGNVYGFIYEMTVNGEFIEWDKCHGFFGRDLEKNGMAEQLPVDISECEVIYI